ncbi:MAG: hypothetical protein EP343_26120 [Deltaproteobacteria bacterium]|nr:MAG: hypothetical protein EP343_26120 [Deltaproteobacteria bacterium]
MKLQAWLLLWCGMVGGWWSPRAFAATAPRSTNTDPKPKAETPSKPVLLSSIQKLHQRGRRLFEQKKYEEALKIYHQTYDKLLALEKSATKKASKQRAQRYRRSYLATLGAAYHWRRNFVQARLYYARCAVQAKARLRKLCGKYLKSVSRQIARIQITTTPAVAKITVRAIQSTKPAAPPAWSRGKKPGVYWLGKGTFLVEILRPGYVPLSKKMTVKAGSRATFHYRLRKPNCPPTATAQARQARLIVPGRDELVLQTPEGYLTSVTMPQSLDTKVMQTPPGQPLPSAWPAWKTAAVVGGVVVAAGLLAAGGYAIYRLNNNVYQWSPTQP